jgi:hypothetical protein
MVLTSLSDDPQPPGLKAPLLGIRRLAPNPVLGRPAERHGNTVVGLAVLGQDRVRVGGGPVEP